MVGGTAVIADHLLNQSDEACGQEQQAPGPQPCRLVTMTSVVKTVYTLQPSCVLSSGLPADAQTRATFKSQLPVKSKEVDVSRPHSGASENDVTKIIKPRRENGQVKATDTSRRNLRKSYKPLSKQKPEEELKDKNQLLEAVNKQLHQKLIETQGELKDLTQKVELLEKFQDNCLAILESKGLNPGKNCLQRSPCMCPFLSDSGLCGRSSAWCQLTWSGQGLPSKAPKISGSSSLVSGGVDSACPKAFQMLWRKGYLFLT